LVELVDLSLQGKQAHWNVVGPRFRTVHQHLDELVDHTRSFADTVAERIVTLGQPAQGLAAHVAHQSKVDPFPTSYVKDEETVKLIAERLGEVTRRLRERIAVASERDPASEEQLWMFHAQAQ
jgi:starvation-inducible DNA-binding protein